MNEEKKKQGANCFIITPIGNENSDIFRKAKGVIDSVIKPVLVKHGFDDIKPAYEILESGMISNQIINRIVNDDLVVANLTGNNPNVMYELAIRHATTKPIIHICENGTVLPFDIKDNRTIFYKDDMLGVQELNKSFENFVIQIDYSKEYKDNPIYNARKIAVLLHDMDNEGRQTEAELLRTILSEISSLKVKDYVVTEEHITKQFVNADMGFYTLLVELYDIKKESLLEVKFTNDISVSINTQKNNKIFLTIMNIKALQLQEFIDLIHNELIKNKINKYCIIKVKECI